MTSSVSWVIRPDCSFLSSGLIGVAPALAAEAVVGRPADEGPDQGLGDAGVDPVHRHMVAVVGAPAEGEFAEVAGADDEAAFGVGDVHQDLRALTRLGVLISNVLGDAVVPDVTEMPLDGFRDGNLAGGDAQPGHQVDRVVFRAGGGPEPGHRDAEDPGAGESQLVESLHRHQ